MERWAEVAHGDGVARGGGTTWVEGWQASIPTGSHGMRQKTKTMNKHAIVTMVTVGADMRQHRLAAG
jgi:hypothetical protein